MNLKVIIVDDDPVILFLHKRLVTDNGWDNSPILFPNGSQTLAYLRDKRNNGVTYFLLLDINMSEISGWELLDQINAHRLEGIYVVIISSSVNSADRKRADLYDQVIAYLEKPITALELQELMERDPFKPLLGKTS